MSTITMTAGIYTADMYYDDRQGVPGGWYASYATDAGGVVDDSEKVWHPDLPVAEDAEDEARAIVIAYLASLTGCEVSEVSEVPS